MKAIKFNSDMVRAVLDGDKTQTRRPIKPQPPANFNHAEMLCDCSSVEFWESDKFRSGDDLIFPDHMEGIQCPCGKVGDRLEVDGESITLEITGIRVEMVQDITHNDAIYEGIEREWVVDKYWFKNYSPELPANFTKPIKSFQSLWDSIYKPKGFGWDTNCYVWVISFKVLTDKVR